MHLHILSHFSQLSCCRFQKISKYTLIVLRLLVKFILQWEATVCVCVGGGEVTVGGCNLVLECVWVEGF